MKLIVITTPQFFEGEAAAVTSLFQNGLEILHLRKPGASAEEMGNFLLQLPMEYMPRIVTHEQFQLASVFGLKGIHLNGRNPQIPSGYKGHVSRSCHSLEEVLKHKSDCNYVFLSPIYDSISKEGYSCEQAFSGTEAKLLLNMQDHDYALVLLDLMLPGIPGEAVLEEIRKKGNLPVIVLTAKDSLDEKVEVLTSGADDYITKPFEIREVLARVQVQLRHKEEKEAEEQHTRSFKDMLLNRDTFQVEIAGKILPKITKQEFAILELLLRNPKQVFSKEDIFEYAWDEPYMGETKTLDVHISNIRKKIKTVTSEEYIETVWGIGYRLHL